MTYKKSAALIISIFISTIACADMVAHYVGGPAGLLTAGIDGKNSGDIISLYTDSDIAAYCNFSMQIVVTKTSILCSYNGKPAPQ